MSYDVSFKLISLLQVIRKANSMHMTPENGRLKHTCNAVAYLHMLK